MTITKYDLSQLAREAETPRQKRNRERREDRQIALFKKQLDSMMDMIGHNKRTCATRGATLEIHEQT